MSPSSRRRSRRQVPMWILELQYRFYAGAVARELNFSAEMTDRAIDAIEDRVAALEEITAASWPRSAVLRRRLRGELRATDALYAEAAGDFKGRRSAWAGDRNIIASVETARRRRGER